MTAIADRIEGLTRLSDHFGFVPDFHDWKIKSFAWERSDIQMVFDAFRMTDEVTGEGFFVLDRRARVTLNCRSVSSWDVRCGEGGTVDAIRWISAQDIPLDDRARLKYFCAGPRDDDVAIEIEPAYGIEGWITCERISFDVEPFDEEEQQ